MQDNTPETFENEINTAEDQLTAEQAPDAPDAPATTYNPWDHPQPHSIYEDQGGE